MTFITWLSLFLAAGQQPQRFDYLVRADFFAGLAGDEARMAKAQDLCERTLAGNPKHPEALVWHGAILFSKAGQAFQKGDLATGGFLLQTGLKEMNDAAALAPDNPGVLIPRGAVLIEGTKAMPPDTGRPLLESAVANYEHVLDVQAASWSTLGDHAKGELLFGLAEGSARLGRQDKARAYFERLIHDAPTSGQAPRAKQWIENGTIPKANAGGCVGCHK
jgi:tetratricopeptide (TPR) repeat protein